jgi:hypothetical protein
MFLDWLIGCRECGSRDDLVQGYCGLCRFDMDTGAL